MNKSLENMIAIWTEPLPVIRYIGDTVEISYEIFEREVGDDEEKRIFARKKGILLNGSNGGFLFVWFEKGIIKGMGHGTSAPYGTRMVLIEKKYIQKKMKQLKGGYSDTEFNRMFMEYNFGDTIEVWLNDKTCRGIFFIHYNDDSIYILIPSNYKKQYTMFMKVDANSKYTSPWKISVTPARIVLTEKYILDKQYKKRSAGLIDIERNQNAMKRSREQYNEGY